MREIEIEEYLVKEAKKRHQIEYYCCREGKLHLLN